MLVPRPDTETLVDWALRAAGQPPAAAPEVADLGTGSGAIALALKHRRPAARVCAVDCSAAALAVARANAQRLGLQVEWHLGDWWQPLRGRRFDLVVSNPPYVADDDPHLAALRHEPALALTPGGDGLSALARSSTARRRGTCTTAAGCCWSMATTRPTRCAGCWPLPASRPCRPATTWPAGRAAAAGGGRPPL